MSLIKAICLSLLLSVCAVIAAEEKTATPDSLPADVLAALRAPASMTLLSLDPGPGEKTEGADLFYCWSVVGRAKMDAAAQREAVAAAVEGAVRAAASGPGPSRCFIPHHGVLVTTESGQTHGLVICFECGHLRIHTAGQAQRYCPVAGKGEALDKLLTDAKVSPGKQP